MAQLKAKRIEQYGPYGSQERQTFNIVLESGDVITKLYIESGDVADSLGFEVVDRTGYKTVIWSNGSVTSAPTANRNGSLAAHQSTKLDLQGELITRISGSIGTYQGITHVVQLRIHTNANPDGYGPYGRRKGTNISDFSSPTGRVLGFFGAQGTYLHSIGISIEKRN